MVQGKGGRLGPDLTGTGSSRSIESIVESIRDPSRRLAAGLTEATKAFPQEYETVTVVTADGKPSPASPSTKTASASKSWTQPKKFICLKRTNYVPSKRRVTSLMPAYDTSLLSDKDLGDIVAYLLGVEDK